MSGITDPASNERVLWGVGTSRTFRAHWALHELRLEYRTERVRSRTGETETQAFTRLNPRQKIPVLCDGDLTMAESAAIVTYLGERYHTPEAPLLPLDSKDRARYYEWMSFICMELDATSLYVLRRHEYLPHIYGAAPAANDSAKRYFARMIGSAARLMNLDRTYLLGEQFTGVDILMTTCLDWAVGYDQSLPEVFADYRERLTARPAYVRARNVNRAS